MRPDYCGVLVGIDIIVQDMNHKEIEALPASAAVTLSDIVLEAPLGSMMRGIHKYADTMFNSYQLKFFLEELAAKAPRNEREQELFDVLRKAAESAINQHGYLWFSGD
jgi:hypothetical protein